MHRLFLTALFFCSSASARAATPPELGEVAWLRDFDEGTKRATATRKPLLVLFDEVPGCQTCVRYGQSVLSHPLIVEAAETLFVPVAIYNNVGGADRKVIKRFREPTWNNPVVRIMDAKHSELTPRINGKWDRASLVAGMVDALGRAGRDVPAYLAILHRELSATRQTATFSMYCFWTGEVCLGGLPGVVGTKAGFAAGAEVVQVTFDPRHTSRAQLTAGAKSCGKPLDASRIRASTKDDKYQLRHTLWRFVPMTGLQATLANSALGRQAAPRSVFSPRQHALFARISKTPKAGWPDHTGAADLRAAFAQSALVPTAP